jgi:uncharacterized protein YceH (UPF0502 family)
MMFAGVPMPLPVLDALSLRVLGALLEKQMSTPEYYPLTLNALVNACNQSSNRDPVMLLDEASVLTALETLRDQKLAWVVNAAGSRVTKYDHALREHFDLSEQEAAVLCELILRGAQTPGELRSRTSRLYAFTDLSEVDAALNCLMEGEEPLVMSLPKQPGSRELRYEHLLGDRMDPRDTQPIRFGSATDPRATRPLSTAQAPQDSELAELREEVARLRADIANLSEAFEAFRKQFD